jgi:Transposase IS116/IS110/IS902 family
MCATVEANRVPIAVASTRKPESAKTVAALFVTILIVFGSSRAFAQTLWTDAIGDWLTAQLVTTAPKEIPDGIGELTTVVVSREICDWERFKNRRTISSFTGLCPGEHSSGNQRVPGSVTKRGNRRLRALLVECAWRMVRFQPQYPPVQKRLGVLAKGARATGAQRKKAIVGVARQLAVDLWRLHTGRAHAAQLGLKA